MNSEELYKNLIGSEAAGIIRGINIGDHIDDVIKIEGGKYERIINHSSKLNYTIKVSETVELQIYYHFKSSEKRVTRIEFHCHCLLYPIFKEQFSDSRLNIVQALNLEHSPLTQNIDKVRDRFLNHFTSRYGQTQEILDDTIDGYVYVYEWSIGATPLCMQYYLDMNDSMPYTRQVLQIIIN